MAHRLAEAQATPRDRTPASDTLQVATAGVRSRANTGGSAAKVGSPSADMLSSSLYSNTNSSELSNGSLLELYARSPASYPDTRDSYPSQMSKAGIDAMQSSSPMTEARDFASSFQDHDTFALPPSDSNASIWSTASAVDTSNSSLPNSKRPSFSRLDSATLPISGPDSTTHTAYATPLPPSAAVLPSDVDSDGSHYDDELAGDTVDADATVTPDPLSAFHASSVSGMEQTGHVAEADQTRGDTLTNTPPSPTVPRRVSSFSRSKPSSKQDHSPSHPAPLLEDLPSTSASDYAAYTLLAGEQNGHSPHPDKVKDTSSEVVAEVAQEPSLDEQQRLEREMLADSADDSRPRTLQEARARAKLRKTQGEAAEATPKDRSASGHPPSQHSRMSAFNVPTDPGVRSSIDSKERPKRDPRRLSMRDGDRSDDGRSSSDHTAPSDYSHELDAVRGYESATASLQRIESTDSQTKNASHRLGLLPPAQVQRPASREMEDLTDAVNYAMNDLSFGSTDDALSTDDDDGDFATPMPVLKAQEARSESRDAPIISAQQLAAVTRDDRTPQFGPKTTSIRTLPSPLPSPAIRTPQGPLTPRGTSALSTSYFQYQQHQQQQQQTRSAVTTPTGNITQQRRQSQQPAQAIPPKRIDVYGKNLPFPPAFASNAIINNRRATSGERARMYAQCINELLHIPTGLAVWMETVQRPAMRQPLHSVRTAELGKLSGDTWAGTMKAMPVSGHVRNEGSYADSIRSDMTFPMRGDGAKAKEIVSVMPSVIESPAKPTLNLPYPGVMAPRSNSTQSFASSNSGGPAGGAGPIADAFATVRSSVGTHRTTQSISGGFFGNLARKNSKRTPAAPSSGSAFGMPTANSQPTLAGMSNTAARSRGYRTVREKSISGPVPPSAAAVSTNSSSDSGQTAVSTRAGSVDNLSGTSGLGLGGMEIDTSLPASRRGTVADSRLSPSIPTYPGTVGTGKTSRSPMGPRAPGSSPAAFVNAAGSDMDHSNTSNSHAGANLLSVEPTSHAFGSGPTFLSRLGGGGSIGSSGGSHPSPHTPASSSPNPTTATHSQGHGSSDHLHASLHPPTTAYGQRSPRSEAAAMYSPAHSSSQHAPPSSNSQSSSPALGGSNSLRSSFSYGTMRDRIRRESVPNASALEETPAFQETLAKLGDILPDADSAVLSHYLRKAKGDDLIAIGDYLQDQSLGKLPKPR